MRKPTLPTMSAAPSRNLCPGFTGTPAPITTWAEYSGSRRGRSPAGPSPGERRRHRAPPALEPPLPLRAREPGLEPREAAPPEEILARPPDPEREAREPRRAERGGLHQVRPLDRHPQD